MSEYGRMSCTVADWKGSDAMGETLEYAVSRTTADGGDRYLVVHLYDPSAPLRLPPPPDSRHRVNMQLLSNMLCSPDRVRGELRIVWFVGNAGSGQLRAWNRICYVIPQDGEYVWNGIRHELTMCASALYRTGPLPWLRRGDSLSVVFGDDDPDEIVCEALIDALGMKRKNTFYVSVSIPERSLRLALPLLRGKASSLSDDPDAYISAMLTELGLQRPGES